MKNNLVFVYGTLRRSERNHYLLEGATCIAKQAWVTGELFNSNSGFPILKSNEKSIVSGELYKINHGQLSRLDLLEGYIGDKRTNFYNRIIKTIYTDQGAYSGYVYIMTDQQSGILKSQVQHGDWKVYRLLQKKYFYYFAYGSCMDDARFKEKNASHHFNNVIGRGILEGYTLRFTRRASNGGRADIVEDGGKVEGKVYRIHAAAIPYLYEREGVNTCCYRPVIVSIKFNNHTLVVALSFVVINKEKEVLPPLDYMEEILRGGEHILSANYLKSLKEKYISLKGEEVL